VSLYKYEDARWEMDEDRRRDAEMEDWDDAHPPNMECGECGYEWHSPIVRSRWEPPEPRYPDCPRCEGRV